MALQTWSNWALCIVAAPLACVGSAGAVRAVVARTRPGLQRLLLCLPAVMLYSSLPFLFDVQSISRASAAAMLLWLANFKLLALCLGRGPLMQAGLSLGQFTALLLWPIAPEIDVDGRVQILHDTRTRASTAFQRVFWRAPENLVIFFLALLTLTHPSVPLLAKTYSAAFGVCCYCDLWANVCASLVIWLHGMEVAPSWNRPWLQTSLADFWARRWNLPTSSSLKYLVYEPLMEGRLVACSEPHTGETKGTAATEQVPPSGANSARQVEQRHVAKADGGSGPKTGAIVGVNLGADLTPSGSLGGVAPGAEDGNGDALMPAAAGPAAAGPVASEKDLTGRGASERRTNRRSGSAARRVIGLAATFIVSGIMHELLLYICTGDQAQLGKQAIFFAIQAPLVMAEQRLVKTLARLHIHLPTWLCIPVASLTLQIPAKYWFWGAYFAAVHSRASPLASPPSLLPVPAPVPLQSVLLVSDVAPALVTVVANGTAKLEL
ncbi:hypothetical protein VaNZ11_012276 [Volvox africanus]|uniref:Wax synthase domain-containing protein n=1 Tax=Volvox africanus TaxID=51714 RepID=A0ABQ5SDG8_9CHLO|nr:hypothetical protein VaNZ11_012276 [Volvox africanus]